MSKHEENLGRAMILFMALFFAYVVMIIFKKLNEMQILKFYLQLSC